jgi:hypothetical protein
MEKARLSQSLRLLAIVPLILGAAIASARAQSTDPDNPIPMTSDVMKGRWPADKLVSHYYSFIGGPGVVSLSINCISDSSSTIVGAQLSDAAGHVFTRLESIGRETVTPTYVQEVAGGEGARLVATYDIKRRQRLLIRFYTAITNPDSAGSYSIRISGAGVSSTENNTSTNGGPLTGSEHNTTGGRNLLSLPKSGKLRLVMNDGTVQEIELAHVREASIQP